MLIVLKGCHRELEHFPEEIRGDLADAISRLELGQTLSMPLSRPMPGIGKRVHELRFRDRSGIYRVIYYLEGAGTVYLLHAFSKKSRQTPQQNIKIAKKRLGEVIQ
jgi:phage-related protein